MKKIAVSVVAGLLIASLAAPAAGGARARKVTHDYTVANGVFWGHGEMHWTLGAEYAKFQTQRGERHVTLAIADASGAPVRGHVHIDQNADGELDDQVDFCGETAKPIALEPRAVVEVGVIMGMCDEATPSFVTEGTITATFTK